MTAVKDFDFVATSNLEAKLSDYRGKNIVLYFYPKDSTPGCTIESKDFTALHSEFAKHNTVIFGISRDKMSSHEKFKAKYQMPFELISDQDESICQQFEVLKEKSMFGRRYMGIERSTFLIDQEGQLQQSWRKVKIKGHADAVLNAIKAL